MTPLKKDAKVVAYKIRDQKDYCAFVIQSPESEVSAQINTKHFKFNTKDLLFIESNIDNPKILQAKTNNFLELKLPKSFNNQIVISKTHNNLLPHNLSIDATKWHIKTPSKSLPTLGQGHEGFGITDIIASNKPNQKNDVIFNNGKLTLRKYQNNGSIIAESLAINLIPGEKYLLTSYYQTENMQSGSGFSMIVKLYSKGKTPQYIYATVMPRNTKPGKFRMAFSGFTVPKDWTNAQARILLSAVGAPFEVSWKDFDLRKRPVLLPVSTTPELPGQMSPQITPKNLIKHLKVAKAKTVERHIKDGHVQLAVNGKIIPKFAYTGLTGPGHKDFYNAEIKLQWVRVITGKAGIRNWKGTPLWLGKDKYDFSPLDKQLEKLLLLVPDATIMLYLCVNPYPDFVKNNPEAMALNINGKPMKTENTYWQSYAANSYRLETSNMLRALAKHLQKSIYGKAVAGVHINGGLDGQWFPYNFDGSKGNTTAFRMWLKKHYKNDLKAFQKAWGDNNLTFETAKLPTIQEFKKSSYFLNPENPNDRRLIDNEHYRNIYPVETFELFAKTLKTSMNRPFYISVYYNDITGGHDLGKNALNKVLTSPWIDGIVGVVDYGWGRLPGYSGTSVNLLDSPALHNKILLGELDYRTESSYLWSARANQRAFGPVSVGNTVGEEENAALQRRDTGIYLTHGQGVWMYALAGNSWAFPQLLKPVKEAFNAAKLSSTKPQTQQTNNTIASFIDERMLDYLGQGKPTGASFRKLTHQVIAKGSRIPFYRSGVKFENYLLSDLTKIKNKYKVYVFISSSSISEQEIQYIEKNLQKDGNILVFLFDVGRVSSKGFSHTLKRLTGINAKIKQDKLVTYQFDYLNLPNPLSKTLNYFETETRGPAFVVNEPTNNILGYYTNTNIPGAAIKEHKNWTAVYIGTPGGITPNFLNAIACKAGIKPIAKPGDSVHLGNGFLVYHAMSSGTKTVNWHGKHDLLDLSTGKTVAKQKDSYSFKISLGETKWFKLK